MTRDNLSYPWTQPNMICATATYYLPTDCQRTVRRGEERHRGPVRSSLL
jgi:hypothetical protein